MLGIGNYVWLFRSTVAYIVPKTTHYSGVYFNKAEGLQLDLLDWAPSTDLQVSVTKGKVR